MFPDEVQRFGKKLRYIFKWTFRCLKRPMWYLLFNPLHWVLFFAAFMAWFVSPGSNVLNIEGSGWIALFVLSNVLIAVNTGVMLLRRRKHEALYGDGDPRKPLSKKKVQTPEGGRRARDY